eukprot:2853103-Rhodomonas_salina.2
MNNTEREAYVGTVCKALPFGVGTHAWEIFIELVEDEAVEIDFQPHSNKYAAQRHQRRRTHCKRVGKRELPHSQRAAVREESQPEERSDGGGGGEATEGGSQLCYKLETALCLQCCRLHYPLYSVLQARGWGVGQMVQGVKEAEEVEVVSKHLHPHFAAQLACIDAATVGVGFAQAVTGPVFETGTLLQVDLPQVINLCHGSSEEHNTILQHALSAAKRGVPLVIVTQTSNKSTSDVEQRLKVWAGPVHRLMSKAAIWQQQASALMARPKSAAWKAIQIWLAGPRDEKRDKSCQGVLTLTPFHNQTPLCMGGREPRNSVHVCPRSGGSDGW